MHILILPSEEFLPSDNPLDGIFQYHQAAILHNAGYDIGIISIKLSLSVPMILKGIGFKLIGRKTKNETDDFKTTALLKLCFNRLFLPKKFITKEVIEGVSVYRIDNFFYFPPVHNKNHFSWIKAGITCFREYIKERGKPDLIHAHNAIYAGMLAKKINQEFAIPYIITEHSSTYALKQADQRVLERAKKAYTGATGLYAVSPALAQLLNSLFDINRFRYLQNVLDQFLEQSPYNLSENKNASFIFLHIASLLPVKDQFTLLNAFQKVAAKKQDVELWIGGGGLLLHDLKEQAKHLGVSDKVKFLGVLDRKQVISTLQQCDCFVLSSKYETFGVVVIEAMLFGKPVIVTRCGIGQDIVNEKMGYVVEVGDDDGLAEAMVKITWSHHSFDPEHIRAFAIENFGKNRFTKDITKIYKEIA